MLRDTGLTKEKAKEVLKFFQAPEREGEVLHVRVHRIVKEYLLNIRQILAANGIFFTGISDMLRYLIAALLLGRIPLRVFKEVKEIERKAKLITILDVENEEELLKILQST